MSRRHASVFAESFNNLSGASGGDSNALAEHLKRRAMGTIDRFLNQAMQAHLDAPAFLKLRTGVFGTADYGEDEDWEDEEEMIMMMKKKMMMMTMVMMVMMMKIKSMTVFLIQIEMRTIDTALHCYIYRYRTRGTKAH